MYTVRVKVSISTISRAAHALGFCVNKIGLSVIEEGRIRCAEKMNQVEIGNIES